MSVAGWGGGWRCVRVGTQDSRAQALDAWWGSLSVAIQEDYCGQYRSTPDAFLKTYVPGEYDWFMAPGGVTQYREFVEAQCGG